MKAAQGRNQQHHGREQMLAASGVVKVHDEIQKNRQVCTKRIGFETDPASEPIPRRTAKFIPNPAASAFRLSRKSQQTAFWNDFCIFPGKGRSIRLSRGACPMDQRHLRDMADLEENYWWHVAKRQLVKELLRRHAPAEGVLVEGGIGTGRNLIEWQSLGYETQGFDLLPEAIKMAKSRGLSRVQIHDLHQHWPLPEESASAILLLDVLEHMQHPVEVLKAAGRVLRPDGVVILTVPAYQWLFGRWDEILGHHRRYTRRLLRRHANEAGFDLHWPSIGTPSRCRRRPCCEPKNDSGPAAKPPSSPAYPVGSIRYCWASLAWSEAGCCELDCLWDCPSRAC
jgi:SAM-dependent methyltransferase